MEKDSIVVVTFHVEKQSNLVNVSMPELMFLAKIEMDNENGKITQVIEPPLKNMQSYGCEFHWADAMTQKFLYKLTGMYDVVFLFWFLL